MKGIEPSWPAWKAGALPLSYTRSTALYSVKTPAKSTGFGKSGKAFAVNGLLSPTVYHIAMDIGSLIGGEKDDITCQTHRPVRADIYFQTTDFTCGPAVLMMAMAALDSAYKPNRLEELRIWRAANLVFMGDEHPGCGPYGLARAAMKRGFTADIYEHHAQNLFKIWTRNQEEATAQTLLENHDRQRAIEEGCRIHVAPLSHELIERLLTEGKQLITLTSEGVDAHWVIIHDLVESNVFIIDPDSEYAGEPRKGFHLDAVYNFIQYRSFSSWLKYGPHESTVLLAIGRPPQTPII